MKKHPPTYWFVFLSHSLLLKKDGDAYQVPLSEEPPTDVKEWTHIQVLPDIGGVACASYFLSAPPNHLHPSYVTTDLRKSHGLLPLPFYKMAGKAAELIYWDQNTRYCGVCGYPLEYQTVISKKCHQCGKEIWPQVSPAIIVRIRKEDLEAPWREKILLVHGRQFRRNSYGLVAGFVETGETLEECVEREVKEETGLRICNLRYFGSQSWPFPSGLMVGFTADYLQGDIHLQEDEVTDGGWFDREHLPAIPDKASIARQLIDDWLQHSPAPKEET